MPDNGHVMCAMALSEPGLVVIEDDVEGPVEGIFDSPVSADVVGGLLSAELCRRDVVSGLDAASILEFGMGQDPDDGSGGRQAQFAGKVAGAR